MNQCYSVSACVCPCTTDVVLFGQVSHACRAAVVDFGVPQEEEPEEEVEDDSEEENTSDKGIERPLLLRVQNFVGSVERLAWAKEMGCPWEVGRGEEVCAAAAEAGNLEVLRWAWEHRCPWDSHTCAM